MFSKYLSNEPEPVQDRARGSFAVAGRYCVSGGSCLAETDFLAATTQKSRFAKNRVIALSS